MEAQTAIAPRAVAIGTFDGVHAGHRAVIARLAGTGLRPTAITFDPHPRTVLRGEPVGLLCTVDRRLELLRTAGAQDVAVIRFTRAMSRMTPAAWIARTLGPLDARAVAVGSDFRFGAGRTGSLATFAEHGLEILEIPLLDDVSSTRIRHLVAAGEIEEAAIRLGRPPEVETELIALARTENGGATLRLRPALDTLVLPAPGPYEGRIDGHPGLLRVGADRELRFVTVQAPGAWRRGVPARVEVTSRLAGRAGRRG